MTTFSFTTGNPSQLTGGGNASMNDIQGSFTDLRTAINGTLDGDNLSSTAGGQLGLSSSVITRRGKTNIAATESRSNVAYGTLTTPDQVAGIVLPTDGLIAVVYKAVWQESVNGAAKAALFLGSNQVKGIANSASSAPAVLETTLAAGAGAIDRPLRTNPSTGLSGLGSGSVVYTGDVTTGQTIGISQAGPVYIDAAAGTYTVSVQFLASSGSVSAKNRSLLVWTVGF